MSHHMSTYNVGHGDTYKSQLTRLAKLFSKGSSRIASIGSVWQ